MIICLDYGHGGRDPGGVSGSRKESFDNLRLGSFLKKNLEEESFKVYETRTRDVYVSLERRVAFSNSLGADYFISIHRNAFNSRARGVETYVHPGTSLENLGLARRIQSGLSSLGFYDRGLKPGNFYVLRKTRARSILLELGFIDNPEDNRIFDEKIQEIAQVISNEIKKTILVF